MDGYIDNLLLKFGHKAPTKPQLSLYCHCDNIYSSKDQFAAEEVTSPKLTNAGIHRVQDIVGAILYYARAINKRFLVGLSAIGAHQAAATEQTTAAIYQLLDHLETYPNDGIIYWTSDIILEDHSDDGFKNYPKARRCAGSQIFLSEEKPTTKWNRSVLTIAQIIKFVMSSAAEDELGVLYITAK